VPSIKLSVTVRSSLERKYDSASLKLLDRAVTDWIAHDRKRGVKTIHVAVDDAPAMKKLGVPAIKGTTTASRIKSAIDALWERLTPDYLVLFGGDEIVPHFVVANPSYDVSGDDDKEVPTDNPYASSRPFSASKPSSYLIPDRVVGRIPDMIEDGDPSWFVDYLATATHWTPEAPGTFDKAYTICASPWKAAGRACVEYLGKNPSILLVSPPDEDKSAAPRRQLASRLHMIKCHGSPLDPRFFGQREDWYPPALFSGTLKPRLKPGTVAAAMCCYGAQVFSPSDKAAAVPGAWPLASTYLRGGAPGFVGSTMIAWVGDKTMVCADWIAAGYLKSVLGGASIGRAFLEAKQDYVRWISEQGGSPDRADEKTLIEFVLLGDPSVQPVFAPASESSISRVAATGPRAHALGVRAVALVDQERRQRRFLRTRMAEQLREVLPDRLPAGSAAIARSAKVFEAARALLGDDTKTFGLKPRQARVDKLETTLPRPLAARKGSRAVANARNVGPKQSIEYYWSGRRILKGHKQIRLVKVETDTAGNVIRSSVLHAS
jgi:peptidase C25-like protein